MVDDKVKLVAVAWAMAGCATTGTGAEDARQRPTPPATRSASEVAANADTPRVEAEDDATAIASRRSADHALEPGMFVLLDDSRGAWPDLAAARAATRPAPESKSDAKPRPTVLARVERDHGEVVEVGFPSEISDDHCTSRGAWAPPTVETWFVRKDLLIPVLVRPFVRTWPDDTQVSFAAGERVVGTKVRVPLPDDAVWLDVAAKEVGLAYRPSPAAPELAMGRTSNPAKRFRIRVGEWDASVHANGPAPGAASLIAWERRCVRLVGEPIEEKAAGGMGMLVSGGWQRVPAGTALTDTTGKPLATLRADWYVHTGMSPALRLTPVGDARLCISNHHGLGPLGPDVCVDETVLSPHRGQVPTDPPAGSY